MFDLVKADRLIGAKALFNQYERGVLLDHSLSLMRATEVASRLPILALLEKYPYRNAETCDNQDFIRTFVSLYAHRVIVTIRAIVWVVKRDLCEEGGDSIMSIYLLTN